jgi:hypothetical protein
VEASAASKIGHSAIIRTTFGDIHVSLEVRTEFWSLALFAGRLRCPIIAPHSCSLLGVCLAYLQLHCTHHRRHDEPQQQQPQQQQQQ